jgi:TrmH family RNA methyltransferase
MKHISSRDNPGYKRLKALLDDARLRRQEGVTIIDGDHLIRAALDAGWAIRQLVLREDVLTHAVVEAILSQMADTSEIIVLNSALFKQISPVVTPTGILAEVSLPVADLHAQADDDVLAIAGVQDAGNLGSLLRTAVAAGIRHVWLDAQTTQAWSPKAMRAGMGAQFNLNIAEVQDLVPALQNCPQTILATSLGAGCISLYAADLTSANVWVFGSEGQGVPAEILALADRRVHIPMSGQIESLNVGAAAAVCLFEQLRQRSI